MIRPQTCPICEKPLNLETDQSTQFFPFCSERCRDIDLYRWCIGKYAVVEPLAKDPPAREEE